METMESYQDLKWDSALSQLQIKNLKINPVVDAWSLHRLAISQRHCGDRYIEGCLEGKDRIFTISNSEKIVATLRLTLDDETWIAGDIKGFANSEVSPEVSELGTTIAQLYMAAEPVMEKA